MQSIHREGHEDSEGRGDLRSGRLVWMLLLLLTFETLDYKGTH